MELDTLNFWQQKTKNKKQKTKNKSRKPFGLSAQWLLYEGQPIASALVLSHDEQLAQLATEVPEAADTGVVVGDLCYDRIRASLPWRPRYRRALGVDDDQSVVVVSSTWWSRSLLGTNSDLFQALLAQLPLDRYRVVAILHPNIWYGHGADTIFRWFAPHQRSGLILIPPEYGWRAALVSADYLVGDHGSVTTYGAALGVPTLLGSFPHDEVAPESIVDFLGRTAPRLDTNRPIRPQLTNAAAQQDARSLSGRISSAPDESAQRLRTLLYDTLELEEPATEPGVPPDRLDGLPADPLSWRPTAMFVHGAVSVAGKVPALSMERYPAEMLLPERHQAAPPDTFLVVTADHPGPRLREIADVLVLTDGDAWGHHARRWAADILTERGAEIAAVTEGESCVVYPRHSQAIRLTPGDRSRMSDPVLAASAVFLWMASGHELAEFPTRLTVNDTIIDVHRVA